MENDYLSREEVQDLSIVPWENVKDGHTSLPNGLFYDENGKVFGRKESFTFEEGGKYPKSIPLMPESEPILKNEYSEEGQNLTQNIDWRIDLQTDKKSCLYNLAKHLVDKYHVKTISGKRDREIYIYENGVYQPGINILRAEIQNMLEELASTHTKNEIIEKIKDLTVADRKKFEVSRNLINLKNGVLDIDAGKLNEHNPAYLFLHAIPVNYQSGADCPAVKKFLSEILDKQDLPTIQEWFGYILYRTYFVKKAIIFVGERDTGKTTLIRLFSSFVGEENVSGVSLQRIVSDKFAAAQLYNKHINIFDDLSFKDVNDNGAFKIATGGGAITGEYKFGDQFQFENHSKLTFACNKIPNVKDTNDDAYFSRWIVIQFNKTVQVADKFLIDKLTTPEEMSGLLNFALEGLQRLLKSQEFSYKKEPDEIKTEMLRSGSVIANFAFDSLEQETDAWVSKDELYQAFVDYANFKKLAVETKETFGKKLRKYADYIIDSKHEAKTGWRNVCIKEGHVSI